MWEQENTTGFTAGSDVGENACTKGQQLLCSLGDPDFTSDSATHLPWGLSQTFSSSPAHDVCFGYLKHGVFEEVLFATTCANALSYRAQITFIGIQALL